jgi:hypothetical protein
MRNTPWNEGHLTGQKRPLKRRDVWAIRVRLQLQQRARDLALFDLAIDSKLRGCDLVRLQVDNVCASGRVRDRTTIIQKKTGRAVQTRASIRAWLPEVEGAKGQYLFPSRLRVQPHLSTRQYARIVPYLGRERATRRRRLRHALDAANKGGSNFQEDGQPECSAASAWTHKARETVRYLGIGVDDALTISEQVEL